jgi:hypothetical protein
MIYDGIEMEVRVTGLTGPVCINTEYEDMRVYIPNEKDGQDVTDIISKFDKPLIFGQWVEEYKADEAEAGMV